MATRAGASGMASDSATPRVTARCICSSPLQMLGNKATCVCISAHQALSSDLRCLRLDPGDILRRMTGPFPGLLAVCFVRAMEKKVTVEGESHNGAG